MYRSPSPESKRTAVEATPDRNSPRKRIAVVDVLRGFVMVLMALDHTREFFAGFAGQPLDPMRTTPLLFLTRWITHLCAPTFVFLAGTSIFLQQQRKSNSELTRLLLTRGLWLIVAELTLVHLAFNFNWKWDVQILEVIWAIGASMIVMAALIRLGVRGTLIVGVAVICLHNLFDGVPPADFGRFYGAWQLLHVPGLLGGAPAAAPIIVVAYPVLPWVGVMALGYAFGSVMLKSARQQRDFLLRTGALMLGAFVLLRWTNLYGDPIPWKVQQVWWRTLASFLNVQKYPPSLLFLLATLGLAALILLAIASFGERKAFEHARRALEVFGRVPFFYFLLHIALIHLLAFIICAATGGDWRWWITEFPKGGVLAGRPPGFGYGLAAIWCIWPIAVLLCYPACKWFGEVKRRSRSSLTSYL